MSKILLLSKPSITNGLSTLLHSTKPPSPPPLKFSLPIFSPGPHSYSTPHTRYSPIRALNTPPANEERDKLEDQAPPPPPEPKNAGVEEYPSGEFEMVKFNWWVSFLVKLRMLFAFPWERVKKGSVLSIKLKGEISEQLASRFSSVLSLPQLCQNFVKATYDPRISGVYLQIEPLSCGWGKVEELRRHIIDFKKSGKFIVSYIPICGEKEYYLACACDEVYMPPSAYVGLYGLTVQSSFLGGIP